MATNVDHLKLGLWEYHKALSVHCKQTREDWETLKSLWKALNDEYESKAAQSFEENWLSTMQWMDEYLENIDRLREFMAERTEDLDPV